MLKFSRLFIGFFVLFNVLLLPKVEGQPGKPNSVEELREYLSKPIAILGLNDLNRIDENSQSQSNLQYEDNLELIRRLEPTMIYGAFSCDCTYQDYKEANCTASDLHAINSNILLQASVDENMTSNMIDNLNIEIIRWRNAQCHLKDCTNDPSTVCSRGSCPMDCQIPERFWGDLQLLDDIPPLDQRQFSLEKIVYCTDPTSARCGLNTSYDVDFTELIDITKPMAQVYMYYIATLLVEMDYNAITFAWIELMSQRYKQHTWQTGIEDTEIKAIWNKLSKAIRNYADEQGKWAVITGHNDSMIFTDEYGEDHHVFDYYSAGINNVKNGIEFHANGGGIKIESFHEGCHLDNLERSPEAIHPLEPFRYGHAPVIAFLDNAGINYEDSCYPWGWLGITNFALQPEFYRHDWLKYAYHQLHDFQDNNNISFVMPGRRPIVYYPGNHYPPTNRNERNLFYNPHDPNNCIAIESAKIISGSDGVPEREDATSVQRAFNDEYVMKDIWDGKYDMGWVIPERLCTYTTDYNSKYFTSFNDKKVYYLAVDEARIYQLTKEGDEWERRILLLAPNATPRDQNIVLSPGGTRLFYVDLNGVIQEVSITSTGGVAAPTPRLNAPRVLPNTKLVCGGFANSFNLYYVREDDGRIETLTYSSNEGYNNYSASWAANTSGQSTHSHQLGKKELAVSSDGSIVYYQGADDQIYALQKVPNSWRYEYFQPRPMAPKVSGSMLSLNDAVFYVAEDSNIEVLYKDDETYNNLDIYWSAQQFLGQQEFCIPSPIGDLKASPGGGKLYFTGEDRTIHGFDIAHFFKYRYFNLSKHYTKNQSYQLTGDFIFIDDRVFYFDNNQIKYLTYQNIFDTPKLSEWIGRIDPVCSPTPRNIVQDNNFSKSRVVTCSCELSSGKYINPIQDNTCFQDVPVALVAIPENSPIIPVGFDQRFLLTKNDNPTIKGINIEPRFEVDGIGTYKIYSYVTESVNLSINPIEIDQTTIDDLTPSVSYDINTICTPLNTDAPVFNVVDCNSCTVNGGSISTNDPTTVCVDDLQPDIIRLTPTDVLGQVYRYIVTDAGGNILRKTPLRQIDFEGMTKGVNLIYGISLDDVTILDEVQNISDLTGCFDLSNSIRVDLLEGEQCIGKANNRTCQIDAGHLFAESNITSICINSNQESTFKFSVKAAKGKYIYVLTDEDGVILKIMQKPSVNLQQMLPRNCLIWGVAFEELHNLIIGNIIHALDGCYELSNPLKIIRKVNTECMNESYINGKNVFLKSDISNNSIRQEDIFQFFPNPTNNYLTLKGETGNFTTMEITVTNYLGEQILSLSNSSSNRSFVEERIDLSTIASGVYLVSIRLDGEPKQVEKITVIK